MKCTSIHRLFSVAGFFLCLVPAAANADAVKLKLAYFTSDQTAFYVSVVKPFVDAVNADGKGIIEIDTYTDGSLGHDPAQVGLLENGTADLALIIPGSSPDVFPDNGVFELPGLFNTTSEASLTYSRILATQTLRGYQDFFVIGAFATDPETIHTKTPVKTLADLKGLRISFNSPGSAAAFASLGIVPTDVPITSAAEAIGKGTIDGASAALVAAVIFGVTKATTYHYLLNVSVAPLLLLMNRKAFDDLPTAAQEIVEKYSGDWIVQRYITENSAASSAVLQQLRANPARKVIIPSLADQATAAAAFAKVANAWQASDPRYPALLAAVKSEVMTLREIQP